MITKIPLKQLEFSQILDAVNTGISGTYYPRTNPSGYATQTSLNNTGQYLLEQIAVNPVGVSSLNGLSGITTINGSGDLQVVTGEGSNIYIGYTGVPSDLTIVRTTGNQNISGSKFFSNLKATGINSLTGNSIDINRGLMFNVNEEDVTINWVDRTLRFVEPTLDWGQRILFGDWEAENLQISGYPVITTQNGNLVIKSSGINFKNTGLYNLYTVPAPYKFYLDSIQIIDTSKLFNIGFTGETDYPSFKLGITSDDDFLAPEFIATTPRTIINTNLVTGISTFNNINITVISGSIAPIGHEGVVILKGILA